MLPVCRSYSPNNVGRSWLRLKHVTTWLFSECARRTRTRIASGYIRTAIRMAAKASSLRIDWQTFLQSRGPRSAVQRSVIQKCLAHLRDGPASTSSLSHPKWKNGGACDFSSPPHRSPPQSKCHEASAMEAGCPAPTRISSSPDTKFQLSFSLFPLFTPAVPLHGATHRYGEAQDSRTAKGSAIPNAGLWNAEAELEKLGYEKRTFECPRCHRVESIVAEIKRGRLALQGTRSQAIPLAGLCFTNIQCIFAPSTTGSVCRPSFIHKVAMTVAFSKLRVALCNQRTV
jgi:hypothetical protein